MSSDIATRDHRDTTQESPIATPHSSSRPEAPPPTPDQVSKWAADNLQRDAASIGKGSAMAGEDAFKELAWIQQNGNMDTALADLEKSGSAKIVRGKNGEPEHIIFNGVDGGKPVDVDLAAHKINGETESDMQADALKQSKEYFAAQLSDPHLRDSQGKPFSPEAIDGASKIMSAILDKNPDALKKAAQEVMSNPALMASVQDLLTRTNVDQTSPVEFKTDPKGNVYMQANAEMLGTALVVPQSGDTRAYQTDPLGQIKWDSPADAAKTQQAVTDWQRMLGEQMVQQAQGYLDLVDRLPADGYSNMADLEREYANPDRAEDNEHIHRKIQAELNKMGPDGKKAFWDLVEKDPNLTPAQKKKMREEFN